MTRRDYVAYYADMDAFQPNNAAHGVGTSLQGYFYASFEDLRRVLGEPLSEIDGYKVSTEWKLVGPHGRTFTLYDYKDTVLYDADLPSVEEFRREPGYAWHVGADRTLGVSELCAWLAEKIGVKPRRVTSHPVTPGEYQIC